MLTLSALDVSLCRIFRIMKKIVIVVHIIRNMSEGCLTVGCVWNDATPGGVLIVHFILISNTTPGGERYIIVRCVWNNPCCLTVGCIWNDAAPGGILILLLVWFFCCDKRRCCWHICIGIFYVEQVCLRSEPIIMISVNMT
jgi:hypothetical protein